MRRDVRTIKTITPTAIAVNTMVIDVPKLNAAPGFRDMVRVRTPPRSRIGARCDSVATTIAFEAMSRARTPAAAPSRMPIRGGADGGAPGSPGWSAALLPLLARHAQDRAGERLQPCLADRLPARFAGAVRARVHPGQRPLGLGQQFAGVMGERELMLPLIGLRAHVGLIIPGITDRVTEPGGDVRLSPLDVRAQPCSLRGQVVPHL